MEKELETLMSTVSYLELESKTLLVLGTKSLNSNNFKQDCLSISPRSCYNEVSNYEKADDEITNVLCTHTTYARKWIPWK